MLRSFMLFTAAIAVVLCCSPGMSQTGATDLAKVQREFASPAKKYRPLVRWWWPGNDVTVPELQHEVDALDKAGFGGAEIQPFKFDLPKLPADAEKRVNDYPTPAFFRHVAAAAAAARKDGLFIDYTFGSGWPFGGAEITPELTSAELRWSHRSVQGPAKLHTRLELPGIGDGDSQGDAAIMKGLPDGWKERLERQVKLVAVVAVRGENTVWFMNQGSGEQPVQQSGILDMGSSVDLTDRLQPDGTIDWNVPAGTWQIFVFRSVPTVHRIIGGVGNGPQLEMNHWDAAAFAAHAKAVGDNGMPYLKDYFGNGIRAIFCDSLEVKQSFYWSDDFLAEFKKRRGYDLLPYLPILKVQGYGGPFSNSSGLPPFDMPDAGDAIRRDYWQTVSDLMIERFFDPFNQWAHEHKLLSRTQSHGAPADILRIYGEADIPETEDLFDNGRYDFLKLASSSAHVYGRNIVGSESFVWRKSLYLTTPEKMKRAGDELLTAGVNAIVYHGFAYRLPGQLDPGWHPFPGAPGQSSYSSQFNEKNPFWPFFAQFNGYLTRLQYISQTGKSNSQVAMYLYELQHGTVDPPPPSASPLQQGIMDAGYNYDHINEESLLASTVTNREMVTKGGAHYSVLVLPPEHAISAGLAERLQSFAAAGLPIIFAGEVPSVDDGFLNHAQRTLRVQAAMRAMSRMHNVDLSANAVTAIAVLKQITAPDVHFHKGAYPYFERHIGGLTAFFLRNEGDVPQHVTADFIAEGSPELWDPWTGKTAQMRDFHRHGKSVQVSFDLDPIGSALIVFTPQPTTTEMVPPTLHLVHTFAIGDAGWKLTATGMLPTGRTASFRRSWKDLTNWVFDDDLKGLAGHGTYTTTFTVGAPRIGSRIKLSLGEVANVAQVKINGQDAGTLLSQPYIVDVTSLLHAGENTLEVDVTDALYNAMILRTPRTPGAGRSFTPSGLIPAGLIGPVQLEVME